MFLGHIWNHHFAFSRCYFAYSWPISASILDYFHQDMHQFSAWDEFLHINHFYPKLWFSYFQGVFTVDCLHGWFKIKNYAWDRSDQKIQCSKCSRSVFWPLGLNSMLSFVYFFCLRKISNNSMNNICVMCLMGNTMTNRNESQ